MVINQTSPQVAERLNEAQRCLQSGQLAQAARLAEQIVKADSNNIDGLYILAVCSRYAKKTERALRLLENIRALEPTHARSWQETGHNFRDLGDAAQARSAYEQAVLYNAALPASWKALTDIYRQLGEHDAAENAAVQAARLTGMARELVSVASFIHEGKLLKAEELCRAYLQSKPLDVEAMRLLAILGLKHNVLDDAEFLLQSCLELEPDFDLARHDYVNVLHKRQKYELALQQAQQLRQRRPDNPAFALLFANESLAVGDFDVAIATYDQLLKNYPHNASLQLSRGHALKTLGKRNEAIGCYQSAATINPAYGDAWWSLANLKVYQFSDREVEQMQSAEQASRTVIDDRIHICFALGKAFEDRSEFADSFHYYARGNTLKQQQLRYEPERMETDLRTQEEICSEQLFAAHQDTGCEDASPIFIVGLPRAGSTLLEQILASHSQVDGTMELPDILGLAHRLNGRRRLGDAPRYPSILAELSHDQLREYGEAYIRDTQIHRGDAPFFIDKMPNNFRHIGLIHLILPNAKIIDARRHPMACCFSGFKQLFAEGQEFSYGLEAIGRYYRGYVELMDHWDRVLPGKILRVQHEELVTDFEAQVRRILSFLGLPFEPACLRFYESDRPVRTASSEQVRQPLKNTGVNQWRNFSPYLDPLRNALGPMLTRYPE